MSDEYPIYLDTTDENNSWLAQQNLNRCDDPSTCTALYNTGDQVSEWMLILIRDQVRQ